MWYVWWFVTTWIVYQILKPMMLRRLKEDVEKSIAPKEETIIEVYIHISNSTFQACKGVSEPVF